MEKGLEKFWAEMARRDEARKRKVGKGNTKPTLAEQAREQARIEKVWQVFIGLGTKRLTK